MSEAKKELMVPITATAIELFDGNKMNPLLSLIKAKVEASKPDVSKKSGRDEMKSVAYKIRRSKTFLDDLGKDHSDEHRKKVDATNGIRKSMRDELDQLADTYRQPLTDYEEEEKAREARIEAIIQKIKDRASAPIEHDSEEIAYQLDELKAVVIDDSFGDRETYASIEKDKSIEKLEAHLGVVRQREVDAAELEQMRKEKEEREAKEESERLEKEQADRDEKIRQEAAENAKREAAEREETLKREKAEAEQREKDAKEKAIRDAKEAEELAEHEKQKAIDAERDRVDAEKKAEREAEEKREANTKHNAKINNAVVSGIIQASGIKESAAKAIVTAIAKGEIPHVGIRY